MGAKIEPKDVGRVKAAVFQELAEQDAADVCEVLDRLMAHRDEAERERDALTQDRDRLREELADHEMNEGAKLEAVKKDLWDSYEEENELMIAKIVKLRRERDDAKQRAIDHSAMLTEAKAKIATLEKERDRMNELISASADLCERGRHAIEMLRGGVTVLEPLLVIGGKTNGD